VKSIYLVAWLLTYISIPSVAKAIITPALPNIEMQYQLSMGSIEWLISAFLAGYTLGQLIYGPMANAYGRLTALRSGLLLHLFGVLICFLSSYTEYYLILLFGRFISGLGAAAGLTCTFMLINEWLPFQQRQQAMSYSLLSFAFGIGISVLIGGLITQYWYWQLCFLFLIIHSFVMMWGTKVFDETLTKPNPIKFKTIIQGYLQALSSAKLIVYSLLIGTCLMIVHCFSAAGPLIAYQYFKVTGSLYGYWNMINIAGLIIGGFSAHILLSYISIYQLIALGFMICGVGLMNLIWMYFTQIDSTAWFFISTSILYISASYFFASGSFLASNAIEDKANASSIMSFINMSFATLTVIIMGYISTDPLIAFISILGSVFLLMLVLFSVLFKYYMLPSKAC